MTLDEVAENQRNIDYLMSQNTLEAAVIEKNKQ